MDTIDDLTRLLSDYRSRFVRFARLYIRDEAVAEDIVMESIVSYWRRRASLSPHTNPPAYILAAIKNRCLNHLEHQRVRADAAGRLRRDMEWELDARISSLRACEPEELFMSEAQRIVDRTLALLPERTRRIFVMSRNEDRSNSQIASHFGISVKGVEFHITKALKALRHSLRDYF